MFHLSFLVILAGVLYGGATRLEGEIFVTEGQTFTETHEEYVTLSEGPLFFENHEFFTMRVDEIQSVFEKGMLVDLSCAVTLADGGGEPGHVIRVNRPLVHNDTAFLLHRFGFAPRLIVTDGEGRVFLNSYVKLSSEGGLHEDYFLLPGTDVYIYVKMFPDAREKGGKFYSASPVLKLPALLVRAEREFDGGAIKQRLFSGYLKPGGAAEFGGFKIYFQDARKWAQFNVRKDRGKAVIFAGFWTGVAGLTLHFLAGFRMSAFRDLA